MENDLYFAAKGLITNDGKFLALKRTDEPHDFWELPGGRMEFGETLEETLRREIFEETALVVHPVKILDSWDMITPTRQISGVIYHCTITEGHIRLSDEHSAYAWLDEEDIMKLYPIFAEKLQGLQLHAL